MNKLISYGYDFVSYLMLQPKIRQISLKKITLFGSVVRDDVTSKSDVDIFIDVPNPKKDYKDLVEKIKSSFLNSNRIKKWKILNVSNELNIIVDNLELDKWENLRDNLSNTVVLWQNYVSISEKIKPYFIIKWKTKAKNPSERVKISRFMYGYSANNKKYTGFVEKQIQKKLAIPQSLLNLNICH